LMVDRPAMALDWSLPGELFQRTSDSIRRALWARWPPGLVGLTPVS
jgi:hypothetical protein